MQGWSAADLKRRMAERGVKNEGGKYTDNDGRSEGEVLSDKPELKSWFDEHGLSECYEAFAADAWGMHALKHMEEIQEGGAVEALIPDAKKRKTFWDSWKKSFGDIQVSSKHDKLSPPPSPSHSPGASPRAEPPSEQKHSVEEDASSNGDDVVTPYEAPSPDGSDDDAGSTTPDGTTPYGAPSSDGSDDDAGSTPPDGTTPGAATTNTATSDVVTPNASTQVEKSLENDIVVGAAEQRYLPVPAPGKRFGQQRKDSSDQHDRLVQYIDDQDNHIKQAVDQTTKIVMENVANLNSLTKNVERLKKPEEKVNDNEVIGKDKLIKKVKKLERELADLKKSSADDVKVLDGKLDRLQQQQGRGNGGQRPAGTSRLLVQGLIGLIMIFAVGSMVLPRGVCDISPFISNSNADKCIGTHGDENCEFSCDTGFYTESDQHVIRCGTNGVWGTVPKCVSNFRVDTYEFTLSISKQDTQTESFPKDLFLLDGSPIANLRYSVLPLNGEDFPDWLRFDETCRCFEGTPVGHGILNFAVVVETKDGKTGRTKGELLYSDAVPPEVRLAKLYKFNPAKSLTATVKVQFSASTAQYNREFCIESTPKMFSKCTMYPSGKNTENIVEYVEGDGTGLDFYSENKYRFRVVDKSSGLVSKYSQDVFPFK